MVIAVLIGAVLLGISLVAYEFQSRRKSRKSQEHHLKNIQQIFKPVDNAVDLELATFPQIVGELAKRGLRFCIIQPGPSASGALVKLVSLGMEKQTLIELLDKAKEELSAGRYE